MIRINEHPTENLLEIHLEGAVTQTDYAQLKPVLEQENARWHELNLLVEVNQLDTATLPALWEDLKLDVKYWNKFGRVALVNENAGWLNPVMAAAGKISPAEVQHFAPARRVEALAWLREKNATAHSAG